MAKQGSLMRIEQSIEIDCSPERIFAILVDPQNVPVYAAGIEGAEIMGSPSLDIAGARLEMVTKGGNFLTATVVAVDRPRRLVIEDERGVRSTWLVEPIMGDRVRLRNVLEGPMPPMKADRIRFDADVKFQALAATLDRRRGTPAPNL